MRVLMLSWEFPPQIIGGLGRHVYELSRRLGNYGVETYVLTPLVDGCVSYEEFQGVKVFRVGTPLTGSKRFKSWIFSFNTELIREGIRLDYQEKGFHLVHAHDWLVGYAGRSLSRVLDVPLVSTIHATEYGRNLGLHNPMQKEIHDIERNLILDSECIVCCSNYMRDEIQNLFHPSPSKIAVIPNGASMNRYRVTDLPSDQEFEGIDKGEPVVLRRKAGPGKGYLSSSRPTLFLQAIPSAAGGGRSGHRNQSWGGVGLGDRVWFSGYVSDDLRDRFITAPMWLSFPFMSRSASAQKPWLPDPVERWGGLGEIVIHGETGLKVNPLDEDNLASALIRILSDPRLANRLRFQALKVITEKYNWDKIGAKTSQVYHAVISRARKDGVG